MGLRREEAKEAVEFVRSLKTSDYLFFIFSATLIAGLFALGYYALQKFLTL